MKVLLSVLLLSAIVSAEKLRFDNHQVYSLTIDNDEQLEVLREMDYHPVDGYLFWNSVTKGRDIDIMVAPHKFDEFAELLNTLNLKHKLKIQNVQEIIDNERPKVHPRAFGWTDYNTLEEIYAWLDELLLAFPNILTSVEIGTSFEGRPIRAVKISHKAGNPTFFLEANIHGNEWITSATATWWLNELLTSTDPEIVELAENIDWYIMPVFNVDGFAYSHRVNRMWRKTRYPHAHICYGTDANRNFDFNWMANGGASDDPCSNMFAGPRPFSEPETVALAEFVSSIASEIKIYLSFHSYGQFVLFAYGHSLENSPDHDILTQIGTRSGDAFGQRYGTEYTAGTAAQTLYIASGISVDWMYGVQNITVGFTYEFRDRGTYGFLLPANQIIDNCLEARDGIVAMIAETRALGLM